MILFISPLHYSFLCPINYIKLHCYVNTSQFSKSFHRKWSRDINVFESICVSVCMHIIYAHCGFFRRRRRRNDGCSFIKLDCRWKKRLLVSNPNMSCTCSYSLISGIMNNISLHPFNQIINKVACPKIRGLLTQTVI